jgi:hypothetical protein
MPDPIELPARVLGAAKKSPTFSTLLEGLDPQTSISRREIDFDEAKDMIRDVISIYQVGYFPRDIMFAESKTFPISKGWDLELFYRGYLCSRQTVAAELRGPGYREDQGEPEFEHRPRLFSRRLKDEG